MASRDDLDLETLALERLYGGVLGADRRMNEEKRSVGSEISGSVDADAVYELSSA